MGNTMFSLSLNKMLEIHALTHTAGLLALHMMPCKSLYNGMTNRAPGIAVAAHLG